MAQFRKPGPIDFDLRSPYPGLRRFPGAVGPVRGTIPGPIGGTLWDRQTNTPTAAATKASRGIRVHPKSQITANAWVRMIQRSKDTPSFFGPQIRGRGDVIFVTDPSRFKIPNDIIPIDWIPDWLAAFVNQEWEMTTGNLNFTVQKGVPLPGSHATMSSVPSPRPDGGKDQRHFDRLVDDMNARIDAIVNRPSIRIVHVPDLSSDESIDGFTKFTMTTTASSTENLSIEVGNTLPGVLTKRGRKLIVVANRVTLRLGSTVQNFQFEESEMVEVWFHEIACHAGRNSRGLTDTHGDRVVEDCTKDIQREYPVRTTLGKVRDAIDAFLK